MEASSRFLEPNSQRQFVAIGQASLGGIGFREKSMTIQKLERVWWAVVLIFEVGHAIILCVCVRGISDESFGHDC